MLDRTMAARFFGAAFAFLFVAFFAVAPARAEGKLNIIASFPVGSTQIDLATFIDDANPNEKVGLISINSREGEGKRNSFACDPQEWRELMELVQKARDLGAADWTEAGTLVETGTTDTSRITISSGEQGLRFVITSPAIGPVTQDLPAHEITRFDEGLRRVDEILSSK